MAFTNKPVLGLGMATDGIFPPQVTLQGLQWAVVRIANDLSILLFASAVAYAVSMRFHRRAAAVAVSMGVCLGLLVTVLCPDLWGQIVVRGGYWVLDKLRPHRHPYGFYDGGRGWDADHGLLSTITVYVFWAILTARLAIGALALRSACVRLERPASGVRRF